MEPGDSAQRTREAAAEPVIVVEKLTAGFGEQVILSEVSFEIRRGEIFFIVGGSGCGKTTLLKNMIGLYRPLQGRILIEGTDIGESQEALYRLRQRIGVLFQSGALIGSMTLGENVALPLEGHARLAGATLERLVRMKLAMVNLAGYENHLPAELSGGMKKRAGLARAMILDPSILFFDEPSSGLDPVTAVELDRTIQAINRSLGTTMVIVSHDLASIFEVAHRVILLEKERGIIAEGDPRVLRDTCQDPRVYDFFHRSAGGREDKEEARCEARPRNS